MLERVARAIQNTVFPEQDWTKLNAAEQTGWRQMARAAISAMREPTGAMERAAMDAATSNSGWDVDVWQARIDAALEPDRK